MKKTTCRDLRGACEFEISGETPEEMGKNSQAHAMEQIGAGDEAHIAAAKEMMALSPEEQMKWFNEFKERFNTLPEA